MDKQVRVWRVLLILLVSMTSGAIILMLLGNNAPSEGAFSLSSYYRLVPLSQITTSRVFQQKDRWDRIDIHYSGTRAGDIKSLAALNGLTDPKQLNCHFIICNGTGGLDGQIQATERWQNQQSVDVPGSRLSMLKSVVICVIADGRNVPATDSQVKRLERLVEALSRRFKIKSDQVHYPVSLFDN